MISPEQRQTQVGIGWVVFGMLQLTLTDVLLKWLVPNYPLLQIAFVRFSFAALLLAMFSRYTTGWGSLRTRRLPLLLGRSLLSLGSMVCFMLAVAQMELADAIAVTFAGPLFVAVLSGPLLGEHVGVHRWGAVIVGFVGVLLIVRPGSGVVSSGAGFALGAAAFHSLLMLSQRALSRTESNLAIVMFDILGAAVVTAFFMPSQWIMPTAADLALLMALGLLTVGVLMTLAQAYRLAPAAVLAPFDYTSLFWGILFGFAIWGDLPGAAVVAGSVVIVSSGLYILHRETMSHRRHER